MYVTVLPKPYENYICAPKANETTALIIFQRVLKLLSGMGLTINGEHVYCGDYIYSGHTMTLIMTYLVIKECEYHANIDHGYPLIQPCLYKGLKMKLIILPIDGIALKYLRRFSKK